MLSTTTAKTRILSLLLALCLALGVTLYTPGPAAVHAQEGPPVGEGGEGAPNEEKNAQEIPTDAEGNPSGDAGESPGIINPDGQDGADGAPGGLEIIRIPEPGGEPGGTPAPSQEPVEGEDAPEAPLFQPLSSPLPMSGETGIRIEVTGSDAAAVTAAIAAAVTANGLTDAGEITAATVTGDLDLDGLQQLSGTLVNLETLYMPGQTGIPDGPNYDEGAFYSHGSLREVAMPNVLEIGDNAFRDCGELTTASFPAAESIGGNAFRDCGELTTASFPAAGRIGGNAFRDCGALTTASFPAAESIGSAAFDACAALTTVRFPAAKSIGGSAFLDCAALTTASFPAAESIGDRAFWGCGALTTASFPAAESIDRYAFYGCGALTTASFPAAKSIDRYAFEDCAELTTASFPAVESIGNSAFYQCANLQTLTLPETVTSIGYNAFGESGLDSLLLLGSGSITFELSGGYGIFGLSPAPPADTVTVYVPDDVLSDRRTDLSAHVANPTNQVKSLSEATFPTAISLSDHSVRLAVGEEHSLSATLTPTPTDPTHYWESSDIGVATVTADGTILAVGEGTTTITVRPMMDATLSDECTVTVSGGAVSSGSSRTSSGNGGSNVRAAASVLPVAPADQTWTGEPEGLPFTVEGASPAALLSVVVDGVVLDPVHYTVRAGSVIVTLRADYLKSLSTGEHTLRLTFWNSTATATFSVQPTGTGGAPAQTGTDSGGTVNDNPSTGGPQQGGGAVWPALLCGSLGAAALVRPRPRERRNAA